MRCDIVEDLIKREDAIQALIETEEIKGTAYAVLMERLKEIPSVEVDDDNTER